MKHLILILLTLRASLFSLAQAPTVEWIHNYGGTLEAVYVDNNGDAFTVGNFSQTTFGTFPLNSATDGSIFLYKSDILGNVLWARQYGDYSTGQGARVKDVITDANGNIFIYGYFQGTVSFGSSTFTSSGATDLFLCKLDAAGNLLWVQKYGSTGYDLGYTGSLDLDNNGNVFLGVRFQVSITIGSTTYTSAGAEDIVIIKFDTNGNILWSQKYGGSGKDENYGVTVDANGNSYYTGQFVNTVSFGTTTLTTSAIGKSSIYVLKLDPLGNVVWAKKMNTASDSWGSDIEVTDDGNLFVSGSFTGSLSFGGFNISSTGSSYSVVLSKLDTDGNVQWAKSIGSSYDIYCSRGGISVKPDGNVVLGGEFRGISIAGTGMGGFDGYVAEYDEDGFFVWAKKFGSNADDLLNCVDVGLGNAIYAGGQINGTVQFDSFTLTETNYNKVFLIRLVDCIPTNSALTETACGSYTWTSGNGQTYNSTATATHVIQNAAGCDSTITLNLTINQPTSSTISETACGTFTWTSGNGQTYNSSTTATHVIQNAAGCDSTITLNLTINQPTSSTISETACGTFTWTSGNGQTYNSSTTATHIIKNAVGCDSTITLNLTINNVDNTVSVNGITLTANQIGATYKWLDCNNGNAPISGATAQSFTPTVNGSYAVEVTANGCTEISACELINTVGTEQFEQNEWNVYPNPNNGIFTITTIKPLKDDVVEVYSAMGQLVYKNIHSGNEIIIRMNDQPNGVYLLKLNNQQYLRILKL